MPTFHVAHSPDSDDAFMFWALATNQIETGPREYVHELADIETLNRRALLGELEITAVSFHAYAHIADTYALLPHGASMGDNYGPRLVTKNTKPADVRSAIDGMRIAIPGKLTTAYLALMIYQPQFEPVVVPFDQIESAVADGDVDAGLLIHEGQLTYPEHGLHLWLDLGAWWHAETDGLPLPLGGNVVRRDLGDAVIREVSRDLRSSITHGLAHREAALEYAMQFARGLTKTDADTFVGMYVSEYTVDYGDHGRRAVNLLLQRAARQGLVPDVTPVSFIDDSADN